MKVYTVDSEEITTHDFGQAIAIQNDFRPVFEMLVDKLRAPLASALEYKEAATIIIDRYNRNAAEISRAQEQAEIDALRDAISNFLAGRSNGE